MSKITWYQNSDTVPDMYIIPHFQFKEFICKCGKCELTPISREILMYLKILRSIVNVPITITSFYRCPEWNKHEGGHKHSYHMRGEACDIKIPRIESVKIERVIECIFPFVLPYPSKGILHTDVGTNNDKR